MPSRTAKRSTPPAPKRAPPAKETPGYDVGTLARVLGLTPRRIQQLTKEGLPQLARGRYPLVPCVQWYIKYWQDRAEARVATTTATSLEDARARKTVAEATLAEIQVAEAESRLIPLSVHEARASELCDRLAARVKGLGQYLGDVQLATSDVDAALLLERISDALLRSLSAVGDELEAETAVGEAVGGHAA